MFELCEGIATVPFDISDADHDLGTQHRMCAHSLKHRKSGTRRFCELRLCWRIIPLESSLFHAP